MKLTASFAWDGEFEAGTLYRKPVIIWQNGNEGIDFASILPLNWCGSICGNGSSGCKMKSHIFSG